MGAGGGLAGRMNGESWRNFGRWRSSSGRELRMTGMVAEGVPGRGKAGGARGAGGSGEDCGGDAQSWGWQRRREGGGGTMVKYSWPGQRVAAVVAAAAAATRRRAAVATAVGLLPRPSVSSHSR